MDDEGDDRNISSEPNETFSSLSNNETKAVSVDTELAISSLISQTSSDPEMSPVSEI